MENICKIFTSEDQTEIRQSFKQILIDRFQEELEDFTDYFFDKDVIDDMVEELFKEILEEVKGEVKEIVKEKVLNSLDLTKLKKKIK